MTTTDNDPLIAEIEQIRVDTRDSIYDGSEVVDIIDEILKLVKQDRQRQQAEKEKMIRQLDGYAFPRNDEGRECVWLDRAISIIQGKEQEARSEKA